jgi:hypothetical protein
VGPPLAGGRKCTSRGRAGGGRAQMPGRQSESRPPRGERLVGAARYLAAILTRLKLSWARSPSPSATLP